MRWGEIDRKSEGWRRETVREIWERGGGKGGEGERR